MCCEIAFYESGHLKCGRLNQSIIINGVEYYEYIYLYANGTLMSSKLYKNTTFDGILFQEGQYVDFDQSSQITSGCVAEDLKNAIKKGSFIRFDNKRKPIISLQDAEYLNWEIGKHGCSADNREVAAWTNDPFGGSGTACTFRDFLQGTINEVILDNMPGVYEEIQAVVEKRHAQISDVKVEIRLIL